MGLAAVVATQLWHNLFTGGSLADLPTWMGIAQLAEKRRGAACFRHNATLVERVQIRAPWRA